MGHFGLIIGLNSGNYSWSSEFSKPISKRLSLSLSESSLFSKGLLRDTKDCVNVAKSVISHSEAWENVHCDDFESQSSNTDSFSASTSLSENDTVEI